MERSPSIRLEPEERESIRKQTALLVPGAEAYIFGSRTNPAARGGDIDLLLLTEEQLPQSTLRKIRRAILGEIGEQKMDIVNFSRTTDHPFKEVALATAARI